MAYSVTFSELDVKAQESHIAISQKIIALENELVKISEERANAEAEWRKKENYLNTEKGKLEIERRALMTATVSEVA